MYLYSNSSQPMDRTLSKKESMFSFYLILIYLFFEYGRPQLSIPMLRYLHLPALTTLLLGISLLISGKLYIKDRQTILYILLICQMLIHGPFAVNNYWAFQIFYQMSVTFIAYLAIVNIVNNYTKYEMLIKYYIIIFIYLAAIGIMKRGIGVGGFIGDENDFCMAINMVLPFAVFGMLGAKNKTTKIYFIFLACLFLFVDILTQSRGGFVGLVAVAAYCWLKSKKKMVLAIIMGLLVLFALGIAPSSYWDEVRSITTETTESNPHGTGAQRIYAWKLGWRMFVNHPIMGVGQGNYPWNVGVTEDELGVQWQTRSLAGRAAHSLYFTLLPELGLLGTILFSLFVIFNVKNLTYIKNVSNNRKDIFSEEESKNIYYMALAMEGSLVGYLISSIFISTLYYPNFWILTAFILSLKKIIYMKCGDFIPVNRRFAIK